MDLLYQKVWERVLMDIFSGIFYYAFYILPIHLKYSYRSYHGTINDGRLPYHLTRNKR